MAANARTALEVKTGEHSGSELRPYLKSALFIQAEWPKITTALPITLNVLFLLAEGAQASVSFYI